MRGLTSQRIVIAALLFLGAVLRFANIGNVSVRSRDEQYYTFRRWRGSTRGRKVCISRRSFPNLARRRHLCG